MVARAGDERGAGGGMNKRLGQVNAAGRPYAAPSGALKAGKNRLLGAAAIAALHIF